MEKTLHVLQHALGLDQYGRGAGHRNYFVTDCGTTDWPTCVMTAADGLMTQTKGNAITGGGDVFRVTPAGMVWVQQHSPKVLMLIRVQRTYRKWARADNNMTFGTWLKAHNAIGTA